jgi:uncharacterized membrane protein
MKTPTQSHSAIFRLALASALPVAMLFARILYTGRITYGFLLWNLFLAWLPLLFAYLALHSFPHRRWAAFLFAASWLLFLPNAPYLITDIMHLHYSGSNLVLYDTVMLFILALCGLLLGAVSLRWMQLVAARRFGLWFSRAFVLMALGMTGFGIYLGRFLRWNSWDLVTNPLSLLQDISPHLLHPLIYWRTWAMTLLFALALSFVYWLLAGLPQLGLHDAGDAVGAQP